MKAQELRIFTFLLYFSSRFKVLQGIQSGLKNYHENSLQSQVKEQVFHTEPDALLAKHFHPDVFKHQDEILK